MWIEGKIHPYRQETVTKKRGSTEKENKKEGVTCGAGVWGRCVDEKVGYKRRIYIYIYIYGNRMRSKNTKGVHLEEVVRSQQMTYCL